MLKMVKQWGDYALKFADKSLRADREVVLVAVKKNGYSLEHADKSLKADREFVLEAVRYRALRAMMKLFSIKNFRVAERKKLLEVQSVEEFVEFVQSLSSKTINFYDDVDFEPASGGAVDRIGAKFTDVIHAIVGCSVDFQHIDIFAGGDRGTGAALAAGRQGRLIGVETVEGLGQYPRH